ncbi:hypothetical protein ACFE04_011058 [Oxalis oulophora]
MDTEANGNDNNNGTLMEEEAGHLESPGNQLLYSDDKTNEANGINNGTVMEGEADHLQPPGNQLIYNQMDNEDMANMDIVATPETQPFKRRRKKSEVWEHFHIEHVNSECRRAICNQCNQSFAYSIGSKVAGTSHLKRHIAKGTCSAILRNQLIYGTPTTKADNAAADPPKRQFPSDHTCIACSSLSVNPGVDLNRGSVMDLHPFKLDIDELINEFVECDSTTLADMKTIWRSRNFSFIFHPIPSNNLAFFMQSIYAHTIGYMISTTSLSRRLGGLYCLYCLYETQPFKPQFKIYISHEELQKLQNLVIEAKENAIFIATSVVKTMLRKHVFLFGIVDSNEASINQEVNQLTELQNARVKVACDKLFKDTRIDHFLDMDLGSEIDLEELRKFSTEYEDAKKRAIEEASKQVDVENIKHIIENKELMVDVLDKMSDDWNAGREMFRDQARMKQQHNKDLGIHQVEEEKLEEDDQDVFMEILERLNAS